VLALVLVLAVTNVLTAAALLYPRMRGRLRIDPVDEAVRAAVDTVAAQGAAQPRQFITIEIHNPIELAATRGRVMSIAGSIAPSFTRRLVYDQTLRTLRQQLIERGVSADVQLYVHTPAETRRDDQPPV
jgi:hypothetical protein